VSTRGRQESDLRVHAAGSRKVVGTRLADGGIFRQIPGASARRGDSGKRVAGLAAPGERDVDNQSPRLAPWATVFRPDGLESQPDAGGCSGVTILGRTRGFFMAGTDNRRDL